MLCYILVIKYNTSAKCIYNADYLFAKLDDVIVICLRHSFYGYQTRSCKAGLLSNKCRTTKVLYLHIKKLVINVCPRNIIIALFCQSARNYIHTYYILLIIMKSKTLIEDEPNSFSSSTSIKKMKNERTIQCYHSTVNT